MPAKRRKEALRPTLNASAEMNAMPKRRKEYSSSMPPAPDRIAPATYQYRASLVDNVRRIGTAPHRADTSNHTCLKIDCEIDTLDWRDGELGLFIPFGASEKFASAVRASTIHRERAATAKRAFIAADECFRHQALLFLAFLALVAHLERHKGILVRPACGSQQQLIQ